jgi:UDP-2-acetamido-3-amino-2,3-dideoxy-glucuronate N-acetyltransferase
LTALQPSHLAPGLLLGPEVELAGGVTLGANVVIYGRVIVEEGCTIQDGAVIGKAAILGPHTRAAPPALDPTTAWRAAARSAPMQFSSQAPRSARTRSSGDRAFVREGARIGAEAVVGGGCQIGSDVPIGQRAKLINNTLIGRASVVEDDVFCGTGRDDSQRHDHREASSNRGDRGVTLRRACRIGAGVLFLPGIEIGEEAFVAAGSLVTRDVPPRTLVMGRPARPIRAVGDEELLERFRDA